MKPGVLYFFQTKYQETGWNRIIMDIETSSVQRRWHLKTDLCLWSLCQAAVPLVLWTLFGVDQALQSFYDIEATFSGLPLTPTCSEKNTHTYSAFRYLLVKQVPGGTGDKWRRSTILSGRRFQFGSERKTDSCEGKRCVMTFELGRILS